MSSLALLNIGNELLDGRTVNTNAAFFAQRLHARGFVIQETRMVGDSLPAICDALRQLAIHEHIIVTGGLGPTADDITAAAASLAFGMRQILHPIALRSLQKELRRRKSPCTTTQKRQALLPERAKILHNTWGTAPGFQLQIEQARFYFLPGVPRECQPLFEKYILPNLGRAKTGMRLLASELWRCFGRREADIYASIAREIRAYEKKYGANFQFSSQIPYPLVDVSVEFWQGRDPCKPFPDREARRRFTELVSRKLGNIVYSRNHATLAEVVLQLLNRYRLTLATAESCTGGWLSKLLTDVPGASKSYLGGVISYANSAKEIFLGVHPTTLLRAGAVSRECALEMAEGARYALHADYAVSLTGISGPDGGSAQKPVGTIFVGFAGPAGSDFKHLVIKNGTGDRLQNRAYASHLALDMLRKNIHTKFKGKNHGSTNQRRRKYK